ncbi:PleD family two-component system response regulator [Marinicauda salina]|uniref:diguanylate cyclase n=1 Tax=Marinicauda salina TaxID=2135793 RepID=A0A2U2BR72_9PROT|nr:PleD family two-component system response regulator [Marinicauda salina]PWE16478.1 PleD family two-component system response regulator [Marinicauda salina]
MSARILVVDDNETNRRLLEARLSAEYFEVTLAADGEQCLELARTTDPDLIILDIMMPGLNGFEVCRRLKSDPATRHVPVIMVTALDERDDRIKGLEAGADDFLTKPVDDIALFARVRSLLRLKVVMDELRLRDEAGARVDPDEPEDREVVSGRIIVSAPDETVAERLIAKLPRSFDADAVLEPAAAVREAGQADMLLIDLTSPRFDGLRLCARLRSDAATRHLPILAIVAPDDRQTMVRALDLGVNDVVYRPVDGGELAARVRTQLRRRRYADKLRDRLEESLEMAVTDALTGLPNRRYVISRLRQALDSYDRDQTPLSIILIDIDHFKPINDTHGHQAGDEVLTAFAQRMGEQLRAVDIAGRIGGEEFMVILAGAGRETALEAAERVRAHVAREPFTAKATGDPLEVTVSAGVAEAVAGDTAETLMDRADAALYDAKAGGRNLVVAAKEKAA